MAAFSNRHREAALSPNYACFVSGEFFYLHRERRLPLLKQSHNFFFFVLQFFSLTQLTQFGFFVCLFLRKENPLS